MNTVLEAVDFRAASAPPLPLPRFRFRQSVIILLVAIPPSYLEAPVSSNRFRFRFQKHDCECHIQGGGATCDSRVRKWPLRALATRVHVWAPYPLSPSSAPSPSLLSIMIISWIAGIDERSKSIAAQFRWSSDNWPMLEKIGWGTSSRKLQRESWASGDRLLICAI